MSNECEGWVVTARFKCRLRQEPKDYIDFDRIAQMEQGKAECPLEGREETICVSHPASNVAGREAAKKFPEKCKFCKKEPNSASFEIY